MEYLVEKSVFQTVAESDLKDRSLTVFGHKELSRFFEHGVRNKFMARCERRGPTELAKDLNHRFV